MQWRSQALFKKGVCQEKTARKLTRSHRFRVSRAKSVPIARMSYWYYKAGFNAARILQQDDSEWQSAVSIYEKLAAAGGLRSDEAKARLSRLRRNILPARMRGCRSFLIVVFRSKKHSRS